MSNDQFSILLYKYIVCEALLDVSYLFNAAEQVSEEVERALAKLGSAKLTGRYQPFPPFPPCLLMGSNPLLFPFFYLGSSDASI